MNTAQVSPEDARHVLWVLCSHDKGVEPGSFTTYLIKAAARADMGNLHRLAVAFPGIAGAVYIYKFTSTGIGALEILAGKDRP